MDLQLILDAISSTLVPLAEKAVGPGFGALFGVLTALRLERYREHRSQFRDRSMALKRAKFFLARTRESLITLNVECLDPLKNDDARWRKFPIIAQGISSIELDLNSLTFLVDLDRSALLGSIFRCQEGTEAVRTTLRERRQAHERLWTAQEAIRREHPNLNDPLQLDELVGPMITGPLKSLTNALYQIVDELLPMVDKTEVEMETLLRARISSSAVIARRFS